MKCSTLSIAKIIITSTIIAGVPGCFLLLGPPTPYAIYLYWKTDDDLDLYLFTPSIDGEFYTIYWEYPGEEFSPPYATFSLSLIHI